MVQREIKKANVGQWGVEYEGGGLDKKHTNLWYNRVNRGRKQS